MTVLERFSPNEVQGHPNELTNRPDEVQGHPSEFAAQKRCAPVEKLTDPAIAVPVSNVKPQINFFKIPVKQ